MLDIITLADAVAAEINTGSFSVPVTAQRMLLPEFELADLADLKVTVVPARIQTTGLTRQAMRHEVDIEIGVQKKLSGQVDTELPQWMDLVEAIDVFLRKRTLAGAVDAAWLKSAIEPLYAREHVAQSRVFTSIITVTYLLIGDNT
jgi:hypothetical protein